MVEFIPGYLELLRTGELEQRALEAQNHLSICDVCALNCPVDRLSGKLGSCKTGRKAKVSSFTPHHFEERPLSGWHGSGTIFFTHCNLHCQYCQNYDISQTDNGDEVDASDIADIMLQLQAWGCHNINLVSPSHVVPQIMAGVNIAAQRGLKLPLVYNTGGYDSLGMLKLLDGIIDIYMPDMKYSDPSIGKQYSKVPNYPQVNRAAVLEMHRQVGDLIFNPDGIAIRGLLVRHLILPNELAGTQQVVQFLANSVSKDTYLNLMDQYHPAYNASQYPELCQRLTSEEYRRSIQLAREAGLHRFD
jgi:putative pyruvate formate lyase activating enzyme